MDNATIAKRQYSVDSDFEYKGYRCLVIFNGNGIYCGYVELPPGHRFSTQATRGSDKPSAYWGITFSEPFLPEPSVQREGMWYIGFDAGHPGDCPNYYLAYTRGIITLEQYRARTHLPSFFSRLGGTFKDLAFMEEELRKLVDDIVDGDTNTNHNPQ